MHVRQPQGFEVEGKVRTTETCDRNDFMLAQLLSAFIILCFLIPYSLKKCLQNKQTDNKTGSLNTRKKAKPNK